MEQEMMEQERSSAEMKGKNPSITRRRIVKGLAAGAGAVVWHSALPSRWTTPIIESISLPAHAQTSMPIPARCTDLVMKQVKGTSQSQNLTVSASGKFPVNQVGQVFYITFEAYTEAVITGMEKNGEEGFLTSVADLLSVPAAMAASPACSVVVSVTVGADGAFSGEAELTCGPGIVQVLAIVRTATSGGQECCRAVLDVHGCNPCSSNSSNNCTCSTITVTVEGNLDVTYSIEYEDCTTGELITLSSDFYFPSPLEINIVPGSTITLNTDPRWFFTITAATGVCADPATTFNESSITIPTSGCGTGAVVINLDNVLPGL